MEILLKFACVADAAGLIDANNNETDVSKFPVDIYNEQVEAPKKLVCLFKDDFHWSNKVQ